MSEQLFLVRPRWRYSVTGLLVAVAAILSALILEGCSSVSFAPRDLRFVPAGSLTGHDRAVFELAMSPSGTLLASAGEDGTARIWELDKRAELRSFRHPDEVLSVAFHPTGELIATACRDGLVRIFRLDGDGPALELRGHSMGVTAVVFSPDGRLLVSAGLDLSIRLWSAQTGEPMGVITGHTERVQDVAFSPDGSMLASASSDETVRLWRVEDRALLKVLRGPRPLERVSEYSVSFSADSAKLLSGGGRGLGHLQSAIREWTIPAGTLARTFTGHTEDTWDVRYLRSGAYVVAAGRAGNVAFWETRNGGIVSRLNPAAGPVWSVAESADGGSLYLATTRRGILVYTKQAQ